MMKKAMKNKNVGEDAVIFQLISRKGKVIEIDDSAVGASVIAVYGSFLVGLKDNEKIEKDKLMICLSTDMDIEVTDMDAEEKILYRNREDIPEYRKPFLIYGLTEKFEFLIYRSPNKKHGFVLQCELKKSYTAEEVMKEMTVSEYYKAYLELKKLMEQVISSSLRIYTFSFEKNENEIL